MWQGEVPPTYPTNNSEHQPGGPQLCSESIRFCPPPHFRHQLQPVRATDWLEVRGSHACSLGLLNVPQQFTEPGEAFYSPGHPFIMKGRDSGIGRWNRCTGRGQELPYALWATPSPGTSRCSPTRLSKPRLLGALWRLHWIGVIDCIVAHWPLIPPEVPSLPLPRGQESRVEGFRPSNHRVGSSPFLGAVQKSRINITKDVFAALIT